MLRKHDGKEYLMVRYYIQYHDESKIFQDIPLGNSKDGADFAMLLTLRLLQRSDQLG